MSDEQAYLIDNGWVLVEVHGVFLYTDPEGGFNCSRELALAIQRERDEAKS